MNKFTTFLKIHRFDFLLLCIITVLTSYVWKGILDQTIEGEGYYYFSSNTSLILPDGRLANLIQGIDNFAKLAYYTQAKFFQGDIQKYMIVELIIINLVAIGFYLFVKVITKDSRIAFVAALYESVYYTGNFQFYARGHLHWFYQRVPELFPIFISIISLHSFFMSRKVGSYLLSLGFFILALFFSHYSTFFLPFYVAYFLIFGLLKEKTIQEKLFVIALSIPYVVINYLITKNASLNLAIIHPNQTLLESFANLKDVPQKILFQLAVTTIPYQVVNFISKLRHSNTLDVIQYLTIPVVLGYSLILATLYKYKSTHLILALSSFAGLIGVLFLTVYFNRVIVFNEIEQGRYYFIPAFYVGIIFSIFLNELRKHSRLITLLIFALCIAWAHFNSNLIFKKMKDSQAYYDRYKVIYRYLDVNRSSFPNDSYIFIRTSPGSMLFLNRFYSENSVTYTYLDTNWRSHLPNGFDIDKLFVFDFGKKDEIEDKTEEYRSELREKI